MEVVTRDSQNVDDNKVLIVFIVCMTILGAMTMLVPVLTDYL